MVFVRLAKQRSLGSQIPHRTPVPVIQELDESSEESLQLLALQSQRLLLPPVFHTGQDEGDGPLPARQTPDSSEKGRLSVSQNQRAQSQSFERLVESLFVDCSPVDFIPASGDMCKCLEVTDCVIRSRNLSKSEGSQALAVWFTEENAELEVQLKSMHNPFVIQKYWKYFVQKYSDSDDTVSPNVILYARRSLFLPLRVEKRFTDSRLLHLLFEEAKERFLCRKYLFSRDDIITLGSLLIYRIHGRYTAGSDFLSTVKNTLPQFFPDGFCNDKRNPKKTIFRDNLLDKVREAYESVSARSVDELRIRFLMICWDNPLYGAAFFPGLVEIPQKCRIVGRIFGRGGRRIRVAVNEKGLFLIVCTGKNVQYPEILLALDYSEFTFQYYQPPDEKALINTEIARLMLVISVPMQDNNGNVCVAGKRILLVFSKQAALIAAALETFVHAKKAARFRRRESRISGDEDADGGESDSDRFDGSPVISLNVLLPTQYSVRASERH